MCAYSSSVWVSGPILYLPFSLPYCIAKESQIVLQIAGDSILLAAGSWKQSEASLRFTCFKHKDTRGPEMCWLWKERKRAESFNGFKSGSGIETYPSAKSLKAKARNKFVSWIFLKNEPIIFMQIIEIKRKLSRFLQRLCYYCGENVSGMSAVSTCTCRMRLKNTKWSLLSDLQRLIFNMFFLRFTQRPRLTVWTAALRIQCQAAQSFL